MVLRRIRRGQRISGVARVFGVLQEEPTTSPLGFLSCGTARECPRRCFTAAPLKIDESSDGGNARRE